MTMKRIAKYWAEKRATAAEVETSEVAETETSAEIDEDNTKD